MQYLVFCMYYVVTTHSQWHIVYCTRPEGAKRLRASAAMMSHFIILSGVVFDGYTHNSTLTSRTHFPLELAVILRSTVCWVDGLPIGMPPHYTAQVEI